MRTTYVRVIASAAALAVFLGACAPQAQRGPLGQIGGTVNVLATWGGAEQESFLAMVQPFEEQTGVQVEYEGTRDLNAVLTARAQGGNPPDVAGVPGPGPMAELARAGHLVDLSTVLDQDAMKAEYAEDWLKMGEVDGKQVAIFIKSALKGLVWYNPNTFNAAGYQAPKTWDEMITLSQRIAGTGTAPWCIGLESGAASGWPGTDWLENIVLRQSGPDVYDRWHQGEIRWTSPEIRKAWETWGQIVATDGMVLGGRQSILATAFGDAATPMFGSPPGCYLHQQGNFITTFYTDAVPGLRPGQDFTFFGFPEIDSNYRETVEVAGDLFGMFRDTPQARALMTYLTSPEAQQIWVGRGGALSPNKRVPQSAYPDDLSRQMAEIITGSGTFRFDASDLMPEAMNSAFVSGVLDYVNNPSNLDGILASLDRVQADAYRR
ncbi:MAG: extracellular solute-binding protein [Chloroflexi bacterium]|nr:extracellular solute-binding protein [Chloroflexota bacterium]